MSVEFDLALAQLLKMSDLYATMIYKDGGEEDENESSLLPLFKRLPKDFNGGFTDFENDDNARDFGIVIPLVAILASSIRAKRDRLNVVVDDDDDDEKEEEKEEVEDGNIDGEGFETFVVRSTVRSEREVSGGRG
ncbi:hypothetical protein PVK06_044553 [Gossypium arboreum]|uniref:Uncharacterized protein n=1 Tax=Gossypium arboreum TaxID=29729 RepID=A0ABR0MRH6_GOSAR|nr:hypothetical protein PVK06_044553 [Gossypium arboreum]